MTTARGDYWWSIPANAVARLRPGLRAASRADSFRLRQLPSVIGSVVLPLLAIGVPVAISLLHATTAPLQQPLPDPLTIVIHDVFTESLVFVIAALAVGLASPAAGALLVIVYGIGNLVVTMVGGELQPPLPAAFGRLVSFGLLWLLAVEIPLLGRQTVEWTIHDEGEPIARRWVGVALGAAVIAALTFAWAQAAPLLITVVYFTTAAWGNPFLAAVQPVQANDMVLALIAGVASLLLLAVRYLGRLVVFSPQPARSMLARLPGGGAVTHVLAAGVALALLSGVIAAPVDAAILAVGLIGARPAARLVVSALRLAGPLSLLPWPVRLILGFGAAVGVDWVVLTILGLTGGSRFSTAVVAIAIGLFVVALFTTPDDAAGQAVRSPIPPASVTAASLGGVAMLGLASLAFPAVASADNCGDMTDCFKDLLKASFAVAGAAILATQVFASKIMPTNQPQGGPLGKPVHKEVPQEEMPDWYRDHLKQYDGPPAPPPPPTTPPTPPVPPSPGTPSQPSVYDPSGLPTRT